MVLQGEQDIRVGLLECIISVHDAGKWVADVDILATVGSPILDWITSNHDQISGRHANDKSCGKNHSTELVSLENWDEILDMPSAISVVRARGNSLARLAATSVLTQLQKTDSNRRVRICPPNGDICLFCLANAKSVQESIFIY